MFPTAGKKKFVFIPYTFSSCSRFGYYVWPTWAIWGLERIFRALRYTINNFLFTSKAAKGTLVLHSPDSVLLTVKGRLPWGWKPGQHAYVAIPAISRFPLESHPFTIASIPSEGDTAAGDEIVFCIQRRNGFTKRLYDYTRANADVESQIPVFIDGPYGLPPDLAPYNTCILVAGKIHRCPNLDCR
jgi:ferric-chelate reductase